MHTVVCAIRYRELNIMNRVLNKDFVSAEPSSKKIVRPFSDVFHPASSMQIYHGKRQESFVLRYHVHGLHTLIPEYGISED